MCASTRASATAIPGTITAPTRSMRARLRPLLRRGAGDFRAVILAAAGLVLVATAAPRLIAAILAAPGDAAAARLAAASLPTSELALIATSRAAALRWHRAGGWLTELGRAEAALAERPDMHLATPEALRRSARAAL